MSRLLRSEYFPKYAVYKNIHTPVNYTATFHYVRCSNVPFLSVLFLSEVAITVHFNVNFNQNVVAYSVCRFLINLEQVCFLTLSYRGLINNVQYPSKHTISMSVLQQNSFHVYMRAVSIISFGKALALHNCHIFEKTDMTTN